MSGSQPGHPQEMPPGRSRTSSAERLVPLLPFAAFLLLLLVTRDRWIVPFRDTGREVQLAERLLAGEVLYRDVVCYYGPLPPLLDAAALGVWRHLDALVALRLLLALAGLAALQRVVRHVSGDTVLASSAATLVVAACFFLPCGSSVPFPYSGAALAGAAGCQVALALALGSRGPGASAAAAVVAGLAAGTKLEVFPAALLAIGPALLWRRPRGEALAAIAAALALGLSAWAAPVLLLGRDLLTQHGYLFASTLAGSHTGFYRSLLFGGYGAPDPMSPSYLALVALAVAQGAAAVLLARREGPWPVLALASLGAATVFLPETGVLTAWVPAAVVLFVLVLARRPDWPDRAALLCLGLAMLAPAARQPLAMRSIPYTPFSAPLALAFAVAVLWHLSGRRRAVAAFVFGLAAAQGAVRLREVLSEPRVLVSFPEARLRLPAPEARLLVALVERLRADTPQGAFVAGFPEGGLVQLLAGRRSPFPDDQFHPGAHEVRASAELLTLLDRKPLAAAFFLNRRHAEFGAGIYGLDYGRETLAALRARLPVETVLGTHAGGGSCVLADQALYLLPARSGAPPPAP